MDANGLFNIDIVVHDDNNDNTHTFGGDLSNKKENQCSLPLLLLVVVVNFHVMTSIVAIDNSEMNILGVIHVSCPDNELLQESLLPVTIVNPFDNQLHNLVGIHVISIGGHVDCIANCDWNSHM